MQKQEFIRIICLDENDPLEYKVLEDVNKSNLQEAFDFINQKFSLHKNKRWLLLQGVAN